MKQSSGRSLRPAGNVRWLIWAIYVLVWTIALLAPDPTKLDRGGPGGSWRWFIAAKALHVGAYAVLAILSGWVRAPMESRHLLLIFLVGHAAGTEFLQWLLEVGRDGSVRDVGFDLLGAAIGVTLSWKWWRQPA